MRQILPSSFSGKKCVFSSFFFHFSSLRALLFFFSFDTLSLSFLYSLSLSLSLSCSSLSSLRRANLVEDGRDREWNWFCSNERRMCCHELMNLLQFSSLLFCCSISFSFSSSSSLYLSLSLSLSLSFSLEILYLNKKEDPGGRSRKICVNNFLPPSSSASSLYHSLPLASLSQALFYSLLPFE